MDYTWTEGFKWFKSCFNIKNARVTRNDPQGVYPLAKSVFQAVKGPGCTLHSFDGLSLDDFISSGSVAARRRLKRLSLAPYYTAQMKRCMHWGQGGLETNENILSTLQALVESTCHLPGYIPNVPAGSRSNT